MFKYTLSAARHITPHLESEISRSYATKVAYKLSKKAAQNHANDGTGKHTHVGSQYCTLPDCEQKVCPKGVVCGQPTVLVTEGHNTHRPPIGRFTRYVAPEDANGDAQHQYFVPTNTKNEMTEQEKQQYGKGFKLDSKTQSYIDTHNDKF